MRRLEAPAACLSHQHAAQPATPRSIQPQTPVRVFPKPVYQVDRRENARAASARSRDFRLAPSDLVTVMRPICLRYSLHIELSYGGLHFRLDYARHATLVGSDARWREMPVSSSDILCEIIWGSKEDWSELHKRRRAGFDVVPISPELISGTFENPRISKRYRGEANENERKRENGNVPAAIRDFSETRTFREISEKCTAQWVHLCDVCMYSLKAY